jgi:periplasmic protein TonB
MQDFLDEILFEKRNKEYGSYQLRKNYIKRLLISFTITLGIFGLLALGCFIYLNTGGDNIVYPYSTSYQGMKSVEASVLDPAELAAIARQSEEIPDEIGVKKTPDVLHNFKVTEQPVKDTFKQPEEQAADVPEGSEPMGTDSAVFGGFLTGTGDGMGMGNDLDKYPVFPGGEIALLRYIQSTVNYPPIAVKQKLSGVVILSFDVNKQGMVDNVHVLQGIHPLLDQEAIKAVQSMPRWTPGQRKGHPVIVRYRFPVRFIPIG